MNTKHRIISFIAIILGFFLIQIKGLSQLNAGIIISSMALSSMFFSMLSAILVKKIKAKWLI